MSTLIADCGSTKVEWAIIHTDRSDNAPNDTSVFRTTGFNAAITPADEIARLLSEELAPAIAGANITRLHFYGAGCIGGDTDRRLLSLMRAILPDAEIEIQGDLLGAARALFGHNPGIACILGTGSNCGMYDGNAITLNTPPMGYILGDEGSGAVLGRTSSTWSSNIPDCCPMRLSQTSTRHTACRKLTSYNESTVSRAQTVSSRPSVLLSASISPIRQCAGLWPVHSVISSSPTCPSRHLPRARPRLTAPTCR